MFRSDKERVAHWERHGPKVGHPTLDLFHFACHAFFFNLMEYPIIMMASGVVWAFRLVALLAVDVV